VNSPRVAIALILLLAVFAASWPFLSERILLIGPKRQPKAFAWRLLELMLLGWAVIFIGRALESHWGQAHPQGWQFYAAMACFFLTLAFPGFIWRYLRRRP
jgi:Na+-driven multidrug efflux pump